MEYHLKLRFDRITFSTLRQCACDELYIGSHFKCKQRYVREDGCWFKVSVLPFALIAFVCEGLYKLL